jgi:hypothetical protein
MPTLKTVINSSMALSACQIGPAGTTARHSDVDINAAVSGSFKTTEPVVSLKVDTELINASAKMFDIADSMISSLLDVRAYDSSVTTRRT